MTFGTQLPLNTRVGEGLARDVCRGFPLVVQINPTWGARPSQVFNLAQAVHTLYLFILKFSFLRSCPKPFDCLNGHAYLASRSVHSLLHIVSNWTLSYINDTEGVALQQSINDSNSDIGLALYQPDNFSFQSLLPRQCGNGAPGVCGCRVVNVPRIVCHRPNITSLYLSPAVRWGGPEFPTETSVSITIALHLYVHRPLHFRSTFWYIIRSKQR